MAMRMAKASAAIVQRVPAASLDQYLAWQRGVTEVAGQFAGYLGTDVYPPAGGCAGDWVTLIHFEDDEALERWLDSRSRAEWVARLRATVGDFELKTLQGGFSAWFTSATRQGGPAPPGWKMALAVLFGLYPTVILLSIFVAPYTSPLGFAFSMLIGNALSVSFLQWVLMPPLTRVLTPWLEADPVRGKLPSLGGLLLLAALLVGMAFLFQTITG